MSYLGLDIGTSGCKAVAFNEYGEELAFAFREYPLITPHEGWVELDSEEVCSKCFEVIKEVALRTGDDPILAMGISSQGEAFTPVDKNGTILGNGMVSSDTRAAAIVSEFCDEFGAEKLYSITGHTAYPMFSLFKLIWIRQNKPELWGMTAKFLCFEDLMHLKLGLDPAIGYPLAGRTMMFNVTSHQWDKEILACVGLEPDQLARPLPSGSTVGTISAKIASQLGLQNDVLVVTGGHDQSCGALGAGIVSKGMAMYATGTVECITPAFERPVFGDTLFQNNYCTYDFAIPGMYTTVAYSLTGGNILKWYRDEFAFQEKEVAMQSGRNIYEVILETLPPRPSKLLVLPYFTPTGTPYFDSSITGSIIGLRFNTSREEILRALLEGVAFEMRLNLSILEKSGIVIDELRAIGGGGKSKIWTQLKANVLDKPITTVAVTEAGCFGVAMLAKSAVTGISLDTIVSEWVKTSQTIFPQEEFAEYYEKQFRTYLKLYPALKSLKYEDEQ
jgi:xylulokinase